MGTSWLGWGGTDQDPTVTPGKVLPPHQVRLGMLGRDDAV